MRTFGSPRNIIGRLLRNRRGNAMVITALSLIPLLAMAGSALDMSRAYLLKSRLQQSCDAAVLGGRRKMGAGTWTDDVKATADRYFRSNFPGDAYGSSNSRIVYTLPDAQSVHGDANVTMPMAIMQIVGITNMNLAASCDARLELPNADIMFVLDTTLSMNETNPGDSANRISALRAAVPTFYDSLESGKGVGTRLRYGFVPYASTVNVGTLLKPEWLADSWTYQSRVADGIDQGSYKQSATYLEYGPWTQISGTVTVSTYTVPPEKCTAPAGTFTTSTSNSPWTKNADGSRSYVTTDTYNGKQYFANLSNGVCTITIRDHNNYKQQRTVTERPNPKAGETTYYNQYMWVYKPVTYSLIPLKATGSDRKVIGGTLSALVGDNHTQRTFTWNKANACIEERQTTGATSALSPGVGYDLDVDTVPTAGNAATQWRPTLYSYEYARQFTGFPIQDSWWPASIQTPRTSTNYVYYSYGNAPSIEGGCPTYALKLSAIARSDLTAYMSALKPAGRTYHDVGFLWGLRLLSAQGIFASENGPPTPGALVARHLIFMTDGQTDTSTGDYDAYGVSAIDRRRTPLTRAPTTAEQNTIVEDRLSGLCSVAKAKGITVWVIAFGTSLTTTLNNCASAGRAFQANDTVQLNTAFSNIAAQIAQLRLTR